MRTFTINKRYEKSFVIEKMLKERVREEKTRATIAKNYTMIRLD
jgi:hypothetical protein